MGFERLTTEELIKKLENYTFKQLHIHHTWNPTHKNFTGENHEQIQQGMKDYHMNTNGWSDIGQHVTLFPDGLYLTGRDFSKTPCSISGWNAGAFAVETVGNFDLPGSGVFNDSGYDRLEGAQKEAILKLAHYFGEKYGYNAIKFHRDNPQAGKTCPGTSIDKDTFITEAKNILTEKNLNTTVHFDLQGKNKLYIDGMIVEGVTFVRARQLLETMGFTVDWDDYTKTVIVK